MRPLERRKTVTFLLNPLDKQKRLDAVRCREETETRRLKREHRNKETKQESTVDVIGNSLPCKDTQSRSHFNLTGSETF